MGEVVEHISDNIKAIDTSVPNTLGNDDIRMINVVPDVVNCSHCGLASCVAVVHFDTLSGIVFYDSSMSQGGINVILLLRYVCTLCITLV